MERDGVVGTEWRGIEGKVKDGKGRRSRYKIERDGGGGAGLREDKQDWKKRHWKDGKEDRWDGEGHKVWKERGTRRLEREGGRTLSTEGREQWRNLIDGKERMLWNGSWQKDRNDGRE